MLKFHKIEDEKIEKGIQDLLIHEDDYIISLPSNISEEHKTRIIHDFEDYLPKRLKTKFPKGIIIENDDNISIKTWAAIRILIIGLFHEIDAYAYCDKNYHEMEDVLSDIIFNLLEIGYPYSGNVQKRNDSEFFFIKGPYIFPNKKMKEFRSPLALNIFVEKNDTWCGFCQLGTEYYDYIWNQEIYLDQDIIDALHIKPGDEVNTRIFFQPLAIYRNYLVKKDGTVWH